MASPCVLGIDYGTDSVRTVVTDVSDGTILSTAVFRYPRWHRGLFCDPSRNQFRQHPQDYLDGLQRSVREALAQAPAGTAARVTGIAIDTTGSTPCALDRTGTPLALLPDFAENPNAMFVLWKDHTAVADGLRNRKANTQVSSSKAVVVSSLTVHPNPSSGNVKMRFTADRPAQVKIHDALGRVVYENQKVDSGDDIDLSLLPKQLWFMVVSVDGTPKVRKLVLH